MLYPVNMKSIMAIFKNEYLDFNLKVKLELSQDVLQENWQENHMYNLSNGKYEENYKHSYFMPSVLYYVTEFSSPSSFPSVRKH